jgi:hypothetical protein
MYFHYDTRQREKMLFALFIFVHKSLTLKLSLGHLFYLKNGMKIDGKNNQKNKHPNSPNQSQRA